MKILLIYPPKQHHMFGSTPHTDIIETEAGCYPPIGLLYIAAYLEKNSHHSVKIIDSVAEKLTHNQLKQIIASEKVEIIGIYFSTFYLYDSILVAKNAKIISSEIITIAGGPHVNLYPVETISIPEIDIAVEGEGEIVLNQIVNAIEKNRKNPDIEKIPGVILKTNKTKYIPAIKINQLDILPFPARHLINYKKYNSILAKHNPITTIISSRSCPFKCKFCSNLESGQKVRFRTAKNVVDELEECVKKYKIYNFLFFDELFTSNKQRVLEICSEILNRKLKISWQCRSRADTIDEQMIKIMKKAGCRLIQFGIETGCQRLQKLINKNLDLLKVKNLIKMVSKTGIFTYGDFMIGLPTETDEETRATIEFAKHLQLDYAIFGMFGPMYGSIFYEEGINKKLFSDFWKEFVNNPQIPISDGSWTRKDAHKYFELINFAYKEFYFRPGYMLHRFFRTDSFSQMLWQIKSGIRAFSKLFFN